jgi:K+ channel tetramerisation domain.
MIEAVKLNVGGYTYQVPKTLIESFPNSSLCRSVCEHLQSGEVDLTKDELFIDGDGAAFRYVINYLRHGHVFLPPSESKDAFLHELEHYGLKGDPNCVHAPVEDTATAAGATGLTTGACRHMTQTSVPVFSTTSPSCPAGSCVYGGCPYAGTCEHCQRFHHHHPGVAWPVASHCAAAHCRYAGAPYHHCHGGGFHGACH